MKLTTLMLLLGSLNAITMEQDKKHQVVSIDIKKTKYKNHRMQEIEKAPEDQQFIQQYHKTISLV